MSETASKEATPFAELERQMMDVNYPKNEREWWSWREINSLRAENERLRADNERLVAVMEALSFASAGRFSITEVETVPIEAMEAAHWEHVRRGTLTMEVIAAAVNVWMDKQKSPGAWADASMYIILPLPAPDKTKP